MTLRELITNVEVYDNVSIIQIPNKECIAPNELYKITRNYGRLTEDMLPEQLLDIEVIYICGSENRHKMIIALKEGVKIYRVEFHNWNEVIPDDGIWMSDDMEYFVDSEKDALQTAMANCYYSIDGHEPECDYDNHEVRYIDDNGNRCAVMFRVKE